MNIFRILNNFNIIIIWIIIYLFWFINVYWATNINIRITEQKVAIWEPFDLLIEIKSDSDKWIKVNKITWLDKFTILSSFSSDNIQVINWNISFIKNLKYWLKANQEWNYVIWPVIVNDWVKTLNSNIVNISVVEFINFQKSNNNQDDNPNINKKNNINFEINDNKKDNSDIDQEDINSIKYIKMLYKDFLFIPIYIFVFLLLVYMILKKYIKIDNKQVKKKIINISENQNHELIKKLRTISNKIESLSKKEFYLELNNLFRKYFEINWINWSFKLTLKELKEKNINKNILNLFEESYFHEFSPKITRIETRKRIIENFIKTLK